MNPNRSKGNVVVILVLIAAILIGGSIFYLTMTINTLFSENKVLKESISRLTVEDQIGFAKVISQETRENKLFTKIKFVETDRIDKTKKILEKEYEIEGDIIHFDALIIKFNNQMVMDGKEKSLYLWNRIYGEKMKPEEGFPIETAGKEPKRYSDIFSKLSVTDNQKFWTEIWQLSNDPDRLNKLGISAIYGNVVYKKLKPKLIYVFKISSTGGLYPETVPEM